MKWYLKVLRQFADFSGRASRREYWMFVLFNVIFAFAFALLGAIIGLICYDNDFSAPLALGFVSLYYIAILVPFLAVSARRLHDAGINGWFVIMMVIPVFLSVLFKYERSYEMDIFITVFTAIGSLLMFVFALLPGKKEVNIFGVHPNKIVKYGEKIRTRSLASALIVATSACLLVALSFFVMHFGYFPLSVLFMDNVWLVALLIAGVFIYKNNDSKKVGIVLVLAAILWIIRFIIYLNQGVFQPGTELISKLAIFQPIALLMAGIAWLHKDKETQMIKPKMAAICLIATSFLSILCEIYKTIIFVGNGYIVSNNITFVLTMSLLILGIYLLPKKEVLPYENVILGNEEYATQIQQLQQEQQQLAKSAPQQSMGWKILGLFVSVALIIGGLSGEMVLRGTKSSTALVVFGFVFFIADVYSIITHKKQQPENKQENNNNTENQ